jgi:hypothetical protein
MPLPTFRFLCVFPVLSYLPPIHIQNHRLYPPLSLTEDCFPRSLGETRTPVELLATGGIAEETYAGGHKY